MSYRGTRGIAVLNFGVCRSQCWSLGIGSELSSFADAALPLGVNQPSISYWIRGDGQGVVGKEFVPEQVIKRAVPLFLTEI
jgi:hypothetical protein